MAKHSFPVFDGDGHVLEEDGELLQHYEGRFKDLRLQRTFGIWPTLDGWARGVINSTEDAGRKYLHTNADIWREMLDLIGVEGTVLYPTAGLACGLISDVDRLQQLAGRPLYQPGRAVLRRRPARRPEPPGGGGRDRPLQE